MAKVYTYVMKIKHVISTRFMSWGGSGQDVFSDEELKYRFNQFIDFFCKTLDNQSCKNFSVFVVLHDKIPESRYSDVISECHRRGFEFGTLSKLYEYVRRGWFLFDRIIDSRLDFDDLVHKDSVRNLQEYAASVSSPVFRGYDKIMLLDGMSGKLYKESLMYPHSQMFSVVYNSRVTPVSDYIPQYSFDHSSPRRTHLGAILDTDHTEAAAVWYRHERAALFSRMNKDIGDSVPQDVRADYMVDRFGTVGRPGLFDNSIVLSVDKERLDRLYKIFYGACLPRPRFVGGCSDRTLFSDNRRCHKAHYMAVQMAQEKGLPFVFVLEDDAYPRQDILKRLNELHPPDDADIYLLGYTHGTNVFKQDAWNIIDSHNTAYGAHAYVIMERAYDKVLGWWRNNKEFAKAPEYMWSVDTSLTGLKTYVYGTPLFIQYNVSMSVNKRSGYVFTHCSDNPPEGFLPINKYGL